MEKGTVKFYNENKGFGFIKPENGDKDIFVHISNVDAKVLKENDQVSYEIEESKKGPIAIKVKVS